MAERRSARLTPTIQPGEPNTAQQKPTTNVTQPQNMTTNIAQPQSVAVNTPQPVNPVCAPPNITSKAPDVSNLRRPIQLGIEGVPQILRCMQSATKEITDVLLYECNIIYECKVCLSLFRGVTNLIAHKRAYCEECHSSSKLDFLHSKPEDQTLVIQPEEPKDAPLTPTRPHKELVRTFESPNSKLLRKYTAADLENAVSSIHQGMSVMKACQTYNVPRSTLRRHLNKASECDSDLDVTDGGAACEQSVEEQVHDGTFTGKSGAFKFYTAAADRMQKKSSESTLTTLTLSPIKSSSVAVYQDTGNKDISKARKDDELSTAESDKASLDSHKENVVKPVKSVTVSCSDLPTTYKKVTNIQSTSSLIMKLHRYKQIDIARLMCLKCAKKLSSRPCLLRHMMSVHPIKDVYICPLCQLKMSRMSNVIKHFKATHGKSGPELEKLRSRIVVKQHIENEVLGDSGEDTQDESMDTQDTDVATSPSDTRNQCKDCRKVFGKPEFLMKHKPFCKANKNVKTGKTGESAKSTTEKKSVTKDRQNEKTSDKTKSNFDKSTVKSQPDKNTPSSQTDKNSSTKSDNNKNSAKSLLQNKSENDAKSAKPEPTSDSSVKRSRSVGSIDRWLNKSISSPPPNDKSSPAIKSKAAEKSKTEFSSKDARQATEEKTGRRDTAGDNVFEKFQKSVPSPSGESRTKPSEQAVKAKGKVSERDTAKTAQQATEITGKTTLKSAGKAAEPSKSKATEKAAGKDKPDMEEQTNGKPESTKTTEDSRSRRTSLSPRSQSLPQRTKTGRHDSPKKPDPQGGERSPTKPGDGKHSRSHSQGHLVEVKGEEVRGRLSLPAVQFKSQRIRLLKAKAQSEAEGQSVEPPKDQSSPGRAKSPGNTSQGAKSPGNAGQGAKSPGNAGQGGQSPGGQAAQELKSVSEGSLLGKRKRKDDLDQRSKVKADDPDEINTKLRRTKSSGQKAENTSDHDPVMSKHVKTEQVVNTESQPNSHTNSHTTSHTENHTQSHTDIHEEKQSLKSESQSKDITFPRRYTRIHTRLSSDQSASSSVSTDTKPCVKSNAQPHSIESHSEPHSNQVEPQTTQNEPQTILQMPQMSSKEPQNSPKEPQSSPKEPQMSSKEPQSSLSTEPNVQIRVLGSKSEQKYKQKMIVTVTAPTNPPSTDPPLAPPTRLHGLTQHDKKRVASLVDEDSLTCLKCGNQYGSSSNLHRHAIRHLGWRRFRCRLCQFTFFNRSECRRHFRTIHGPRMADNDLDPDRFMQELEPDKIKTQTISMPRVEVSPRASKGAESESYNISTRKTARKFDTSPFQRADLGGEPTHEEGATTQTRAYSETSPTCHKTVVDNVIVKPAFLSKGSQSAVCPERTKPLLLRRRTTSQPQSLVERFAHLSNQPTVELKRVDSQQMVSRSLPLHTIASQQMVSQSLPSHTIASQHTENQALRHSASEKLILKRCTAQEVISKQKISQPVSRAPNSQQPVSYYPQACSHNLQQSQVISTHPLLSQQLTPQNTRGQEVMTSQTTTSQEVVTLKNPDGSFYGDIPLRSIQKGSTLVGENGDIVLLVVQSPGGQNTHTQPQPDVQTRILTSTQPLAQAYTQPDTQPLARQDTQQLAQPHTQLQMPSLDLQQSEIASPEDNEVAMATQMITSSGIVVPMETENSNQSSCLSNSEIALTTEQVSFATGDDLLQMIDEDQRQPEDQI